MNKSLALVQLVVAACAISCRDGDASRSADGNPIYFVDREHRVRFCHYYGGLIDVGADLADRSTTSLRRRLEDSAAQTFCEVPDLTWDDVAAACWNPDPSARIECMRTAARKASHTLSVKFDLMEEPTVERDYSADHQLRVEYCKTWRHRLTMNAEALLRHARAGLGRDRDYWVLVDDVNEQMNLASANDVCIGPIAARYVSTYAKGFDASHDVELLARGAEMVSLIEYP